MPIDPSVYAQLGQNQGANLFGPFAEFAYGNEALTQGALGRQQLAARTMMGQLAAQSRNPDGSLDAHGYMERILTNPVTAPFAPQVANELREGQYIDAQTFGQNLANLHAKYSIIANVAHSVAQDVPNDNQPADTKAFISSVADLVNMPGPDGKIMFPAGEVAQYIAANVPPGTTNAQLKMHAAQMERGSFNTTQAIENIGSIMGQDANGQPVPYFYSKVGALNMGAQGAPSALAAPAPSGPTVTNTIRAAGANLGTGEGASAPPDASTSAQSSNSSGIVAGSPVGPSELVQGQLKQLPDYIQHVNAGKVAAQELNYQLDQLDLLRKQFKPGAGASTYTNIAQLMQAAGMRDDWVQSVANGSLPAGQTFNSISNQLAFSLMKNQLLSKDAEMGGAGRLLQTEVNNYLKNKVNWEQDPRTITNLIAYMRKGAYMASTKADALQLVLQHIQQGKPIGGMSTDADIMTKFEPYWANKLYSHGLITQGTAQEQQGVQ